jgi:uncharacterized membrane protein
LLAEMNTQKESTENEQSELLDELKAIVERAMKEEQVVMDNLMNPPIKAGSFADKISDRMAAFGGSWYFLLSFLLSLAIWIYINASILQSKAFDPYPFILLNLILSCIAAVQAPIIMMSQNRLEKKDRMRSENDYMINLKAELEIRSLHQKIDLLITQHEKLLKKIT